jgi:hypothetical protein
MFSPSCARNFWFLGNTTALRFALGDSVVITFTNWNCFGKYSYHLQQGKGIFWALQLPNQKKLITVVSTNDWGMGIQLWLWD